MTYFTREIDFSKGTLKINQATIGDVGHVVWDAAIVLSKYIDNLSSKGSFYFKDQHVVELGAGTGLVGLVAGMHGYVNFCLYLLRKLLRCRSHQINVFILLFSFYFLNFVAQWCVLFNV